MLYYQPEGYFAVENYRNWLPDGDLPRPRGMAVNPANDDWAKQISGAPRVWLVLYRATLDDPVARAIEVELSARYDWEQKILFRGIALVEYRARQ